jgi:hypothetical protein
MSEDAIQDKQYGDDVFFVDLLLQRNKKFNICQRKSLLAITTSVEKQATKQNIGT